MIEYTTYAKSGAIIGGGLVHEMDFEVAKVMAGGRVIMGRYLRDDYYVDTETLEAVKFPPKPSGEQFSWDYGNKRWADQRTVEQAWDDVRTRRDALLVESDWRVTRAMETGIPMTHEWVQYRQDLRDITRQPSPFEISWPTPPVDQS